jgi:outer membrane protein assembly factor BamB
VTRHILLLAGLFAAAVALPASAENWPQWRGPKNDGHSPETGLPAEWGPDKNVAWKLKLPGQGESTPCVWGDRMFLTSVAGPSVAGSDVVLMCVGTDGKEKWRKPLAKFDEPGYRRTPDKASNASASSSTDGKHVWSYVGGKTAGRLTCHDFDGNLVWEKDVPKQYGAFEIQFGTHWSPCLYRGRLYLQVMHRNAQLLVCLDAATGKEVWKVDRPGYSKGESPDVYASPVIWEGEGGPLLIAHGNDFCTGHKLENGEQVWKVEGLNPNSDKAWRFISCPLVSPDLIVVPSCKYGPTVGLNPVGAKGTIEPGNPAELWRMTKDRDKVVTPDVPSPLRVGDVVYLVEAGGKLTALEAKSGKVHYASQPLTRGFHRANPVYSDGKIYVTGIEGGTAVVKPGPKFELIATNTLPDKFRASPAVSGGRIYLRGYDHLWAIGTK